MNPILLKTLSNLVIFLLSFVLVALLQKGFFWPFMRVKLSFGKYVLVKIREINRDLYAIGSIDENMLVYPYKKDDKRIEVPKDKPCFYKTVGVTMIDVDSEKNAVCTVDYTAVTGFDAVKNENLYIRALTKPTITDNREKLIMVLLIGIGLGCIFIGFMVVKMGQDFLTMKTLLEGLNKGLITAGGGS